MMFEQLGNELERARQKHDKFIQVFLSMQSPKPEIESQLTQNENLPSDTTGDSIFRMWGRMCQKVSVPNPYNRTLRELDELANKLASRFRDILSEVEASYDSNVREAKTPEDQVNSIKGERRLCFKTSLHTLAALSPSTTNVFVEN